FICVHGCHTCARSRVTQSELPELMRGLWWHAAVARWARGVRMRVDVSTGLIVGVKQVLSPFFDARPEGVAPDLIVLHRISLPPGEFGGPWITRLFTGNLPPNQHPYFAELQGL